MTKYPHAQSIIQPPTSPGSCFICKKKVSGDTIEEHLLSCLPLLHWLKGDEPSFLIQIVCKYNKKFWLTVLTSPTATLKDLDSFIRDVWVECCGHLSDFEIGRVFFSGDGNDEDMHVYIKDVLQPGDECLYRYDFGSTTILRVTVLRIVPVIPPDRHIVLLGQNSRAHHVCMDCKGEADYAYKKDRAAKTQYFCSSCLERNDIDDEYCSYLTNSPRAGVCGCTKGDEDGVPWYPDSTERKNLHSNKQKTSVRRFKREDLYSVRRDPLVDLLLKMKVITDDEISKPVKNLKNNPDPFPKTIPDSIITRYSQIHILCVDFCNHHPELDLEKPVLDLLSLVARIPDTMKLLERGTEASMASGFIYAIGQMKGLFTRGKEKGLKSHDIGDAFKVKGDVPKSRAYLIRTELRRVKREWNEEYTGTIFDGQVGEDWVELMDEWVGDGWNGMRKPAW
ncbi:DUF6398 domain-containing protein [Methanospirillum lacunae]|uniref:DUF6398 domain-containing protein n=1 Tax=Methanospirillum lacunae TaxID=668570 RepID=A0A2V2N206_9EURY|nr:DUF6398 domain-containing protein [Methanospirillum lacunae]PWR72615.1 hypothetical protein DK846_06520 [Methanospirillum lacunae]